MKEFIRENMDFGTEYCLDNDDVRVGVKHGYIIGTWVIPHKVAQLITFVDHGKLYAEQLEQMDRLDQQRVDGMRPTRTPGSNVKPWDLPGRKPSGSGSRGLDRVFVLKTCDRMASGSGQ
ncbi:MAG: hypothetical protein IPH60_16555 [Flavobacteriales bacterium]|nr:hypothetical protein [Flavobacteriales bacterium]